MGRIFLLSNHFHSLGLWEGLLGKQGNVYVCVTCSFPSLLACLSHAPANVLFFRL